MDSVAYVFVNVKQVYELRQKWAIPNLITTIPDSIMTMSRPIETKVNPFLTRSWLWVDPLRQKWTHSWLDHDYESTHWDKSEPFPDSIMTMSRPIETKVNLS
jgi:hypothetical protein